MQAYKDIDNDSGVADYENGQDYITVRFKTGAEYTYSYSSAGAHHIETMKRLAADGDGLNAYINIKVRHKYLKKR